MGAEQNVVPEHTVMNLCVKGSRWLFELEQVTPRATLPDRTGSTINEYERMAMMTYSMATIVLSSRQIR
jgi:hypothetical protein